MRVLVTGGTNGMGKGVAKALASMGKDEHELIILCRSHELGQETVREFEEDTGNTKVSLVLCDLTKLSDVDKAINELNGRYDYLDGIFINAGLGYAAERVETPDGMDSHFQVNYLSQFMLVLNLLSLLEKSDRGGRIVFNVTEKGRIYWDDMQMKEKWTYERGIHQAMVAKRMFLKKLHRLYENNPHADLSFVGFQIHETVWTNQINIIPGYMKFMASVFRLLGKFITIEKCGEIISPLFCESKEESMEKSGKFISWRKNSFVDLREDEDVMNEELQDRLWDMSLELCGGYYGV